MKTISPLLALALLSGPVHAQDLHWEISGHGWSGAVDLSVDVDGDGLTDPIIGDKVRSEVKVRSGLDGAVILNVDGIGSGFDYGVTVVGIPDLNGDGFDDLGFTDEQGTLRVHDGQTGSSLRTLTSSDPSAQPAAIGDVNGDGYADIAFGIPAIAGGRVSMVSGRYIVEGTAPTFLWTEHGHSSGDRFGAAVAAISDVDSDGINDVIVSAPEEEGLNGLFYFVGRVRCLSGATGDEIWVKTYYDTVSTEFGSALASAGDVNGDFVEDVLVGAPGNDSGGVDAGAGFVLSGTTGAYLDQLYHGTSGEEFGSDVASAGDQDQDGTPDHLFGAPRASSLAGKVFLYSGATMTLIDEIPGSGQAGDHGTLAGGRDATGDGQPDFLVSSPSLAGTVALWGAGCNGTSSGFCTSAPNSSGLAASLHVIGLPSISQNDMSLEARQCPPGKPGIFFYGTHAVQVPFGDGYRCAGGAARRMRPIVVVDSSGVARLTVDFGVAPLGEGPGAVGSGDVRYFQYWFRDPMGPGGSGYNLTDGQQVTFCQ